MHKLMLIVYIKNASLKLKNGPNFKMVQVFGHNFKNEFCLTVFHALLA